MRVPVEKEHIAKVMCKNLRNLVSTVTITASQMASLSGVTRLPVVPMLLAVPAGESHTERAYSWAHGFVTRLRT